MVVYTGTAGADTWFGTTGNDIANGGAGDDYLDAKDGNDTVNGDDGNDILYGGPGIDILNGGAGDDTLTILFSDLSAGDQFYGGSGTDTLFVSGDFSNIFTADVTGITIGSDIEILRTVNSSVQTTITQLSQFSQIEGIFKLIDSGFLDLTGNRFTSGSIYLASGDDILTMAGNIPTALTYISAGAGNDHLTGSEGADALIGQDGNDLLEGGGGNDDLEGGPGNDTLMGGSGNDDLSDGAGDDVMNGGPGDDTFHLDFLDGFSPADQIIGGSGVDTLYINASVYDHSWVNFSLFNIASDVEGLIAPNAWLMMSAQLASQFQNLQLAGLKLTSGGTFVAGPNFQVKTLELAGTSNNVDFSSAGGGPFVIKGGSGNDTIQGSSHADYIVGGGGNDILHGGDGLDELVGGEGIDWIDGGNGNDILHVAIGESVSAGDRFTGGAGTDVLHVDWDPYSQPVAITDLSNSTIDSDVERLEASGVKLKTSQLSGFSRIDVQQLYLVDGGTISFAGKQTSGYLYLSDVGNNVTLSDNGFYEVRGGASADSITGGLAADHLYGMGGNDTLAGGAGDDLLVGGAGTNTLIGGAGSDSFIVESTSDVVQESVGQGNDIVLVSTATGLTSYSLSTTAEIEWLSAQLTGSSDPLDLTGNDFAQRIDGNNGPNHLFGGRGDDLLHGYDGDDNLAGGEGADAMIGGGGNDYYNVDNVGDVVTELPNEGIDQVTSYLSEYTLPDNVEVLRFGSTSTLAVGNASNNDILASGTLRGLDGNDLLVGLSGNDILEGGNGNDVLTGGLGTDMLTGGAGSDVFRDTAAGLNGDTIADLALGERITITDVNLATFHYQLSGSVLTYSGGTLIFQNAPVGHFIATAAAGGGVDLTLTSRTVHNDFNGDGRSDILWRSDSGALSDWLANANGGFASNDGNAYGTVPTSWKMAGTGDFNGDGRSDILWRNNDGSLSDWLANSNGGFAANDANAFTKVATSWHVVSTGDFNGDGREDLLWRSDSGALSDWLANANGSFTGNDANAYTTVATSWKVAGTGDFNGDGREDILWRSDGGALSDWLANANGGFTSNDANAYATAPISWHIAGTGDFNGDGREDILWRSDSGALSDWLANANGSFTSNDANAYATVPTSWHIAGTGDYNGDGREDILWRSDSGALSNWLANTNGGFAVNDANAHAQASTDWHIQAHDYLIV